MRRTFIVLLSLFCTTSVLAEVGSNYQLYFDSHTFAYSETAPIKQIVVDDLQGPYFDGGQHSFTHNLWELGVKYEHWLVAYLVRYDYILDYNRDTAELIYNDKNDISLEKNRQYLVDIQLLHSRTIGMKLGYEWQILPNFFVQTDLSYLESHRLLAGEVSGQFFADEDDYSGQIDLDYVYSSDYLLERDVEEPTGRGYALDIAWRWQSSDKQWKFSGKWTDLLSKIYFKKAPYTTAQANTNRVSFDENGRIDVKPVLSGKEGYRKYSLRFPKQIKLVSSYQIKPNIYFGFGFYRYAELNFPSTHIEYRASESLNINAGFDFKSDALTLGFGNNFIRTSLTSDRLSLARARTLGLDIAVSFEL